MGGQPDQSEKTVAEYLTHCGHTDFVYEPNGHSTAPDFLVDGQIAVEVRRLNQHHDDGSGLKGLEEVSIPLWNKVRSVSSALGPKTYERSWFVLVSFRRPVDWKRFPRELKSALTKFAASPPQTRIKIELNANVELTLVLASKAFPTFFVLGGGSDHDSGGWVLSELQRNLSICVAEKSAKSSKIRHQYSKWWLALVDHIGYALDEDERSTFRQQASLSHDWDRIILIDPTNYKRSFDL